MILTWKPIGNKCHFSGAMIALNLILGVSDSNDEKAHYELGSATVPPDNNCEEATVNSVMKLLPVFPLAKQK